MWDDDTLIRNNIYIKDFSRVPKVFSGNIEAGAGKKTSFYRPIQVLTYMLDYRFWELDEKGYHVTNAAWHISVALALFWLVNILFHERLIALLAGLFFVAHPIHAEAVSYISGRAEPLSAFFILLSFIFYVKNLQVKNTSLYFGIILSYVVALLSKESSIIFPVVLLFYHFSFKEKIKPKQFLAVLGVTSVYLLWRFTLLKDLLSYTSYIPGAAAAPTTLLQRMPGCFAAVASYLKLLILPFDLHMEYGNNLFSFGDVKVILGIVILFGSLIYAFRKKTSNTLVFFSIGWFFIVLLPVSNLYPINAYMAEHWLYLPSIGFFLVLSQGLSLLYRNREWRIFAAVLSVILLTSLTCLTRGQNGYWREPITFYERTLQYAPDSHRLYNNLGNAYSVIGKTDEAMRAYHKSIEVNKTGYNYAQPYNGLAVAYINSGEREKAVGMLKKTIEIDPGYTEAYYNLGQVYGAMNKSGKSIEAFEKAVAINPVYSEAHHGLSKAYYHNRDYDLAIQHSDLAARLGYEIDPVFLKKLEPYRNQ